MADCRLCRWYQPRYSKVVAPIWARAWCGYRGAWMSGFGMERAAEQGCAAYEERQSGFARLGRTNGRQMSLADLYWLGHVKRGGYQPAVVVVDELTPPVGSDGEDA